MGSVADGAGGLREGGDVRGVGRARLELHNEMLEVRWVGRIEDGDDVPASTSAESERSVRACILLRLLRGPGISAYSSISAGSNIGE